MSFRILGLDPEAFRDLHSLPAEELEARGVQRVEVEKPHSAPCRISLDDEPPGAQVLLLNYLHQPAQTPYRQQGPIFIGAAMERVDYVDAIPPALARRTLSLRGFDADDMMTEADIVEGGEAGAMIERFFANARVQYIHVHYARRGCFAAVVQRL